jgi:hypothetical protein
MSSVPDAPTYGMIGAVMGSPDLVRVEYSAVIDSLKRSSSMDCHLLSGI